MSDYDFTWWVSYFQGRPIEDIRKQNAIIRDLLAMEAGPDASREEKDLARAYDPNAMRYATFINSVVAFASAGLIGPADTAAVAAEAGRLGAAQKVIGRGPGVPDLPPDQLQAALDLHCRELLDAVFTGRLDKWMQENAPDEPPRELPG